MPAALMSKLLYLENKCLQPGIKGDGILSVIGNIDPGKVIMIFTE